MEITALLEKYNVAAPRYTSYPTVPYWETESFTNQKWVSAVQNTFISHNGEGISLYIHLPYCESLCTYCGCNTRITKNHDVELPYVEAVLKEWEMYCAILGEKPEIKELHLGGGTPTFFHAVNLHRLIEGIFTHATLSSDAELSFEAHPANTTIDHLHTLYQLGFRRLSLGIQDFDPFVQLMINRFQTPAQVAEVTAQARIIGFSSINFDLIYGLPGQKINGLQETIKEVVNIRPDRIAFYSYAHVPWLKPGQRHYTEKDIPVGKEKYALYLLGKEMLSAAGYNDVGMDHFALETDTLFKASTEHQLHRNFMGYTNQHTRLLIGLGVSSISDCWCAFAQNPKTVEAYLKKINESVLPVEKGHILTSPDLKTRQHILNLMCKDRTFFKDGIPQNLDKRLAPLVRDKLVWITKKEIEVTQIGKSFIRNICMALDDRLWAKQQQAELFSKAI